MSDILGVFAVEARGTQLAERPLPMLDTAPRKLLLALACAVGVALGVGSFTFRYASGLSYFSREPSACANCHIMQTQYDAWQKASHHSVAVCIDCHLPHDFLPKYFAKAENGYRHSKEFTAGTFEEPIRVQARGMEILQENCVRCHQDLLAELNTAARSHSTADCVRCHSTVGHGESARLGGRLRPHELKALEGKP